MDYQRFSTIENMIQDKWVLGCPAEIAKGALLIDNQSNDVVLQLNIRNISSMNIKYVELLVKRLDAAGNIIQGIETPITVNYNDLNVPAHYTFGDRTVIYLGVNSTRKVEIIFNKIILEHNVIWQNESQTVGQTYPKQEMKAIFTSDFIEQYDREYQSINAFVKNSYQVFDHMYYPESTRDYWICTCGLPNLARSQNCGRCGVEAKKLFEIADKNYIEQKLEQYRNKPKQLLYERILTKKFKRISLIVIPVIIMIILCVAAYGAITQVIAPEIKYNLAISFVDNKKYEEAINIFTGLGDYKDSRKKMNGLYNVAADQCFSEGNYGMAIEYYTKIKNIPAIKETYAAMGDEALNERAFETAKLYYERSGKTEMINEVMYQEAVYDFDNGKYIDCYKCSVDFVGYYDNYQYDISKYNNYKDITSYFILSAVIDYSDEYKEADIAEWWEQNYYNLKLLYKSAQSIADFRNTQDYLNDKIFFLPRLEGEWISGENYFNLKINEDSSVNTKYNLPCFTGERIKFTDDGRTMSVGSDAAGWKPLFKFDLINNTTLSVYEYKTGKTFTLYSVNNYGK